MLGAIQLVSQSVGAGLGCPNTDYSNYGFNAVRPVATIEYDNMVTSFHTSIVRNGEDKFLIWGSNAGYDGTLDLSSPQEINTANFPGLIGHPIKVAAASYVATFEDNQQILLTTEGLYAWGNSGVILHDKLTKNDTFQRISIKGKADGLPAGVNSIDVKMMVAAQGTLAIATCSGEVWVISQHSAYMKGDGSTDFGGPDSKTTWSRVRTDKDHFLENVIAVRSSYDAMIALTSANEVYTWGKHTLLGNENISNQPHRAYATKMVLPSTGTVKMIGLTNYLYAGPASVTYYLLYSDGNLYAMGNNALKQLGDFTLLNSPSGSNRRWVQPRYNPAPESIMNDVRWISPNENDRQYAAIHIINDEGKLWNWGCNAASMLGRTAVAQDNGSLAAFDPGQPLPSVNFNPTIDKVLAVETGGHLSGIALQCQEKILFTGHSIFGSCSPGNLGDSNLAQFSTTQATIQVDGAQTMPEIRYADQPILLRDNKVCSSESVRLLGFPDGGYFTVENGAGIIDSAGVLTFTADEGVVKVRYHFKQTFCLNDFIDKDIEFTNCELTHVKGMVWLDENSDLIRNPDELGTNGYSPGNEGLWINLLDSLGVVVRSNPINPDGTYDLAILNHNKYSLLITNEKIAIGVLPPDYTLTLPTGWAFTGHSAPGRAPCLVPDCNTPGIISDIVINGNDLYDVNFGINGAYKALGSVHYDLDGLNVAGSEVDGLNIFDAASEYTIQNNPPLFVSAVDQYNRIILTVPVNPDGTFKIMLPVGNHVNLQLTTLNQPPGVPAALQIIPGKWSFSSESFGQGNASGSGQNDGTGTGANDFETRYDGKVSISYPIGAYQIEGIAFGIEQKPTAEDKEFDHQWNDFIEGSLAGFPVLTDYKYLPLSSSLLISQGNDTGG